MSDPDWRDDWMDAELSGEAAFADPPPGAADRVLKGVLATVATGATVAGTATAGAAAASSTGVAATGTALWIKGLVLTGLVAAGGVGISQMQSEPAQPPQPKIATATPQHNTIQQPERARVADPIESGAPASVAPSTASPIVAALAAPETQAPIAPPVVRPKPERVAAVTPKRRPEPRVRRAQAPAAPVNRLAAAAPAKPPAAQRPLVSPAAKPSRIEPPAVVEKAVAPVSVAPASVAPAVVVEALVEADTQDFNRAPTGLPRTDADLRVQRSVLTGALAALRAGQPSQAQRRLREYRRRFGAGRLDQEHRMIAIRAHLAAGETDAARKAAQTFIQRYPQSALRATVERLVR